MNVSEHKAVDSKTLRGSNQSRAIQNAGTICVYPC